MPEEPTETPSPTALLKNLQVAAPCAESWEKMPGGDRIRSCARCRHRVYNLSEMTSAEAAELIQKAEGRLCVRFYRRADGTILTKDCPVGVQAARQRFTRSASAAVASVAFACGAANFVTRPRSEQPAFVQWALNLISPEEQTTPRPSLELPMFRPESGQPGYAQPVPVELPQATMGTPAPAETPHATLGEAIMMPPPPPADGNALRRHTSFDRKPAALDQDTQIDARPDPFVRQPAHGKTSHK